MMIKAFRFPTYVAFAVAMLPASAMAPTSKGELRQPMGPRAIVTANIIVADALPMTALTPTRITSHREGRTVLSHIMPLMAYLDSGEDGLNMLAIAALDQPAFDFSESPYPLADPQIFSIGFGDSYSPSAVNSPSVGNGIISPFSKPRRFGSTNVMGSTGASRGASGLDYFDDNAPTGANPALGGAGEAVQPSVVPLPAGLPLILLGLGALAFVARKRRAV